ncbi:MAG: type VI secretion system tube protein Hcp [Rhizobiaceae bacterium]|nr:type VI secretion system tube protein Hcp [Rhizobiaceae bacterium]MCV0408186.1 type VI secretion system tube protein Hcp [Rhizobiaceae bacterium]
MSQTDYFLKIDGVEGESKDQKLPGQLEIESWSWGETNAGSFVQGTGGGKGKVAMQDFHFTVRRSKASPVLFMFCATGKHIPTAKLSLRRAGGDTAPEVYEEWTFTDCLISSYQTGGSGGDVLPMDQVSFNFAKVEFGHKAQKEDGSLDSEVKHGYDLKQSAKV